MAKSLLVSFGHKPEQRPAVWAVCSEDVRAEGADIGRMPAVHDMRPAGDEIDPP